MLLQLLLGFLMLYSSPTLLSRAEWSSPTAQLSGADSPTTGRRGHLLLSFSLVIQEEERELLLHWVSTVKYNHQHTCEKLDEEYQVYDASTYYIGDPLDVMWRPS